MLKRDISILDLFAGAGGLSLGFHLAGYKPGIFIDSCPFATESLETNFSHLGGKILNEDLSKLTPQRLDSYLVSNSYHNHFDMIIGGPPCQGWSMAGRAKLKSLGRKYDHFLNDDRNKLIKRYLSFISYFKPKVCLMENVPGLKSYYGFNVLAYIEECFHRRGYRTETRILNCADYGIPQKRERLFIVGIRKELNMEFQFPEAFNKSGERKFPLVTLKDAIGDLPVVRDGSKTEIRKYTKNKSCLSSYAKIMRDGASQDELFDHICTKHRPDDIEAFKLMKQGGTYKDLPKRLKRYRDDTFSDKYKRLRWDESSRTVTAHLSKDCYSHIHPSQARTITVREAARIQSFPDKYYFHGGMCSKFKLIGNAVPPLIGKILAEEIHRQIFRNLGKSRLAEGRAN